MRNREAPIIPEKKSETDTDNFARMEERINASEREHPFVTAAEDKDTASKKVFLIIFQALISVIESSTKTHKFGFWKFQ